ncbi:phage major capsid protein [Leuconostoc gelidum]|uniref:phage major capsid protein n=1 Tax=Leuconostoc gelidum TaxID=1244 RepID=UPI001C7D112A|nr:phage major capsid protein [Leuconostoc gelidum]MBZ6011243.1 phage major capsid protein [Leuconostoc gelidum subsp. aenigmaticum]
MSDTLTQTVEIRAKTDQKRHLLSGYAIVFNSPSENMGFIETVGSHALDDVDLSSTFALYNHNFDNVLGKTGKNLSLSIDEKGLFFSLELLPSDEHIFELVQDGIINKMSFGFIVQDDDWQDSTHRTILKIKELQEISLVPMPAYTGTDIVAKRGLEMADDTKTQEETQLDLKAELDALKAEVEALKAGDSSSEEQTVSADDKADDVEEEDKEKEETRNMVQQAQPQTQTETRSFIENLKAMETRSGITSADAGVLVPKSILQTVKVPTDTTDLANHVNKVQVKSGVGVLPVLAKNNAKLVSAAEMAENPEITGFSLIERDYKLVTYRGALALSKEIISDAPNVEALVSGYIQEAKSATEEQGIANVLKQAKAVSVADVKALKQAFNTGLANYKDKMWVVSESFYNAVDTLQDNNGRFLLQDSIASASGVSLFGAGIIVVPDTELGADGEAHAFIGSLKQFVAVPYKDDVQVAWVRNENFEEVLAVAIREAFVLGDSDAGKFITFSAPAK